MNKIYIVQKELKKMYRTSSDFSSFGALLKGFRKRRQVTQKHLAEIVGVHRSAVIRWEQGNFLPETKGVVLELANHLRLNDRETRSLLEASLTALSPHWLVPSPRNPFFTGREEILQALHTRLGKSQMIAFTQSCALHGLGGIGKTQIALEYAYRHVLDYSAVFWIKAETDETAISSLLQVAELLQLPELQQTNQQHVVAAVQRWLQNHGQWLLIWDNLQDLELLQRLLPAVRQGSILLTTRGQALGTLAQGVDIAPMEQAEGILLVLRRAKVLQREVTHEQIQQFAIHMPTEYSAALELVSTMGGLPLALDQVGAYIEETGCSTFDYLQRYHQMHTDLLGRRGIVGGDHPHSVSTTFLLAYEQVQHKHSAAADLLRSCAFLHAEAIPEELFGAGAVHLGSEIEALAANPSQFDLAIGALRSLSLVQRHPETHTFSIHRLVQTVLLGSMNEQQQIAWLQRVMAALNAAFPEVTHEVWRQCERLLPHVLTCAKAIPESAEDQVLARVLQKAASYLQHRGQYDQAKTLYQRALRIQERILEADHPDLTASLTGLGFLYAEQKKYEQAEPLYRQVLSIQQRTLRPEDPALAFIFHQVAALYDEQGKDEQAEAFYTQALHILDHAPGPDRHKMANSLTGLAVLYFKQKKYEQAEPLYLQALSIWEKAFGLEHPLLTYALNGLASMRSEQEKYEQAEPLYRRALSISEQTFGPEHPNVAYILANQAECYTRQGKYEQAEALYRRTLSIWEKAFGPEHPNVAYVLANQAECYTRQGKYEQAEPLYRRALAIREQHLGHHHPETIQTLHDLAALRQKQGHLSEALSLAKHALSLRSQFLGDAHPKTTTTRALCAQVVQEQVDIQEEVAASAHLQERRDTLTEKSRQADNTVPPLSKGTSPSFSQNDSLQRFFDVCCELHPHAWCRSSHLWQTYERWATEQQERFPLSRRAFAAQMKARGFHTDRTNIARIWRGIALLKQDQ